LELQVAERESLILAEQQRIYESRLNEKDAKIAQLESLVSHLSGELDAVVRTRSEEDKEHDVDTNQRQCDPATDCVIS
jgi:hypothetical protein